MPLGESGSEVRNGVAAPRKQATKHPAALTVVYGLTLGVVMTLENVADLPDIILLAAWLLAPAVGYLVGHWWVVLAVVGALIGRTIGWDPAEHDGNPALWPPYVASNVFLGAFLLLLGVGVSVVRDGARRRSLQAKPGDLGSN